MKQKEEAVKRMKKIGFQNNIIEDFKNGILHETIGNTIEVMSEEHKELVAEFEKEYGAKVYYATENDTMVGTMLALFFVSKYVSEWECDMEDIDSKCILSYVYNIDTPLFSEFGSIFYDNNNGVIVRVG